MLSVRPSVLFLWSTIFSQAAKSTRLLMPSRHGYLSATRVRPMQWPRRKSISRPHREEVVAEDVEVEVGDAAEETLEAVVDGGTILWTRTCSLTWLPTSTRKSYCPSLSL